MELREFMLARLDAAEQAIHRCIYESEPGVGQADLDRVDAYRRIVKLWPDSMGQWSAAEAEAARTVKDSVLRILAESYAGHPDYRDEWRP